MDKILRTTIKVLLLSCCLTTPSIVLAQDSQRSQVEMEQTQIAVNVNESNLRVKNAEGQTLDIFSLTGEKVYSIHIEGASKSIDLAHLQRGYYIVKIGKYTRKIYLH